MPRLPGISANLSAFLQMIKGSEGVLRVQGNDDGYNVLVGGTLFYSYADHPRLLVALPNLNIKSTAAGAYQLLSRYFDAYKTQLHLFDFSPIAQDTIAVQQIKECLALTDIEDGAIDVAVGKCAHIWASLPGAGYGQRENQLGSLLAMYRKAGGIISA